MADKYHADNFDGIQAVVETETDEIVCLTNPSDCHITDEQAEKNAEMIAGRLNAITDILHYVDQYMHNISEDLWPNLHDDEKEILESLDDDFYKNLRLAKRKAGLL